MIAYKLEEDNSFTLEGLDLQTMQLLTQLIGVLVDAPATHDELYANMTEALGDDWNCEAEYFEIDRYGHVRMPK